MLAYVGLLLVARLSVGGAADWAHAGDHGVAHWAAMFPTCAGESQSPININTQKNNDVFVYDEKLTNDLDIVRGQDVEKYYLVNNGHTAYIDTTEAQVSVTGANLGKTYSVVGPHFHWGSENSRGSEHTFNRVKYPLEMHIVTYDAETYDTVGEAVESDKQGALAVVGVMFKLSEEDNPALEPIVSNLGKVVTPDKENKIPIPYFPLTDLLPEETSEYFRYSGSLTTPTCNEVVTWTLLLHPQPVSQRQLDAFCNLHEREDDDGTMVTMVDNYRPVQPLNGRKVYKSFQEPSINLPVNKDATPRKQSQNKAGTAAMSLVTVVAMLTAAIFLH